MRRKVSDIIAEFFEKKGVKHAFGIIGSANAHIFDSVFYNSHIELICPHHEQAATMAVQTYWKVSGQPTFALVTAGAGSSNAITGVLSAWADSIPCLILSGQENARYISPKFDRRMYGIQGYDSPFAVSKMTKFAARVMEPEETLFILEKAWHLATTGRPGPCWVDFPQNIQSAYVEENSLRRYAPEAHPPRVLPLQGQALQLEVKGALARLRAARRPLLWLGVGIRMANAQNELEPLVDLLGVPALVSWTGIDLLPTDHSLVMGSAGVYGQRAANFILQSCDCLLTIGTRMAIPQVGYDISELARAANEITVVDIDLTEVHKYPQRVNHPVHADAAEFMRELRHQFAKAPFSVPSDWLSWCAKVRERFPRIGPEHADPEGFINSYRFIDKLNQYLKDDQVIVTDMGTALLCGHQALRIKPPQRLITSQGLGEMGFGLVDID